MSPFWFLPHIVAAAELSGEVRDELGQPLEGVSVYVINERLGYGVGVTDVDGRFDYSTVPAGRYRLYAVPHTTLNHAARFWPDAWDYCDGEVLTLAEDDVREGIELVLPEGASVTGAVVDSQGRGVSDVEVSCLGVDLRNTGLDRSAVTDADGAFLIVGLDGELGDPDAWQLRFEGEAWPKQYMGGTYDDDEAEVLSIQRGEQLDVGQQLLLDGITVSGRVDSVDGPVEDASVHIYASSQVITVGSDEDGAYFGQGLPPGDVILWASIEGYALTYWPDDDRPTEYIADPGEGGALEEIDFDLPWEAGVEGILDGFGEDLSDGGVLLYNDTRTVGVGTPTEEDGSFRVPKLYGGAYTMYVYGDEIGLVDDYLRDESGEPRVIDVSDGETFELGVLDVPLGATITGVIRDDRGAVVEGGYVVAVNRFDEERRESGVSGADGVYTVDGLHAGDWWVDVSYTPYCDADPDYVPVYYDGVVDPGAQTLLTVGEGDLLDLDVELPQDYDHDGMGDAWEDANGLDTGRDDSAEDPDGDGLSNLEEYWAGSDPNEQDATAECGRCSSGSRSGSPLVVLLIIGLFTRRRS